MWSGAEAAGTAMINMVSLTTASFSIMFPGRPVVHKMILKQRTIDEGSAKNCVEKEFDAAEAWPSTLSSASSKLAPAQGRFPSDQRRACSVSGLGRSPLPPFGRVNAIRAACVGTSAALVVSVPPRSFGTKTVRCPLVVRDGQRHQQHRVRQGLLCERAHLAD